jgi:isocitrate/isopropylmalate dehydrogenase
MKIVQKPESFDVIVAENMFGNILSNIASGIMGGLGLGACVNIGETKAYFEPLHGSAPEMELYRPNPSAMFLAISMMFDHYGYDDYAKWIKQAVTEVIQENKVVTYDLGGQASCIQMAAFIINKVQSFKDNS